MPKGIPKNYIPKEPSKFGGKKEARFILNEKDIAGTE